jgi:hypothetical protein
MSAGLKVIVYLCNGCVEPTMHCNGSSDAYAHGAGARSQGCISLPERAGALGATYVSCSRQTERTLRRRFAAAKTVLAQLLRPKTGRQSGAGTQTPRPFVIDEDTSMFQASELGVHAAGVQPE